MIRAFPANSADVIDILQPAAETNERFSLERIVQRGACFSLIEDGKQVGAFVLERSGRDLWITAAAGRSDIDLTDVIAECVMALSEKFESIVFRTTRVGLVKKALTHGYECVMRKKL